MKNTRKAFTLVELIVVITILAILGTIAFVSLQWYSSDARNTKRTSDLNSLMGKISAENAAWTPLLSFVTANTNNKLPTANISLAWTGLTATQYSDKYEAGTPNYTSLWVKEEDFKDPTDKQYAIAVTTLVGGQYEIAASIEDWAGWFQAAVVWTYTPRSSTAYGGDNTASVDTTNNLVVVTDETAWFFKKGDTIKDTTSGNTTTITKVSNDKLTLTVADASIFSSGSTINLWANETDGLIDSLATSQSWTPVTDGWTDLPY